MESANEIIFLSWWAFWHSYRQKFVFFDSRCNSNKMHRSIVYKFASLIIV